MTHQINYTNQQYLTLASAETTEASATAGLTKFFSQESLMNFLPIILIFAVFYFFIIRPQIKKQKDQADLIQSAKKGDKVIVAGGIIGKITNQKEGDIIVIEISKGTQIEVLKSSIVAIVDKKILGAKSKKK